MCPNMLTDTLSVVSLARKLPHLATTFFLSCFLLRATGCLSRRAGSPRQQPPGLELSQVAQGSSCAVDFVHASSDPPLSCYGCHPVPRVRSTLTNSDAHGLRISCNFPKMLPFPPVMTGCNLAARSEAHHDHKPCKPHLKKNEVSPRTSRCSWQTTWQLGFQK